jgi:hypothetical protein
VPYVREMLHLGLEGAARRLQQLSPVLATQFLLSPLEDVDFTAPNLFLLNCYESLAVGVASLTMDPVVRTLSGQDVPVADLLLSPQPVTVYLRVPQRKLRTFAPFISLVYDGIIGELLDLYDTRRSVRHASRRRRPPSAGAP